MMSYINRLISICEECKCSYLLNEPLKKHTTFKVGGLCRIMISVNDTASLMKIVAFLCKNGIRYAVLGNGSNIIADDEGFDGVILLFGNDFSKIRFFADNYIECEAGASLSKLCAAALEKSLTGLEFAWGIPGTVGGALYMNAGAYGGEMSDVVLCAEFIDENGELKIYSSSLLELSYRHSVFSDSGKIITRVMLSLKKGDYEQIKARMNELMQKRKDKQPLEYPSAGSTFKRPDGAFASALIEQCGLKGASVGGAEVSRKHSGFIVNKSSATSEDILKLVDVVKKKVLEDTGFTLELEPKILK